MFEWKRPFLEQLKNIRTKIEDKTELFYRTRGQEERFP